MTSTKIQSSFASGELSPTLNARVDLAKYQSGAALLRNFFVDYRGGASTRPGTKYVGRCIDSYPNPVILLPFEFSTVQTYVLEFGAYYMRVIKDGAQVLADGFAITGITQADPAVVTAPGHTFVDGDTINITGVNGMTQVNSRDFTITNVTAATFELQSIFGIDIDSSAYGAYVSGGTVAEIYSISTPYASQHLRELKYTQSADVMTITHQSYPTYELTRTAHNAWTLSTITFQAAISAPSGLSFVISSTSPATTHYAYSVTTVNAAGEESTPSVAANALGINIATTAGNVTGTWSSATSASYYNVYKALPVNNGTVVNGAQFGFIGNTETTTFVDANILPDFSLTPPQGTDPFTGSNYPGTVTYFQQRLTFAGSSASPDTVWMSQPGYFHNMDVTNPIRDDNAITVSLASQQVNSVRHMISMPGGLVLLTSGSAWQISGGGSGAAVTPSTIVATPQAYNGCNHMRPLVIDYEILYVQPDNSIVRDLSYDFLRNIYTGTDITVLANHFFTGHTLIDWCYSLQPFKLAWVIRSDGKALSLTFLKEQEVQAWTSHDTQGLFVSTCSIREDNENAVYFVIARLVQGQWVQYIERLASRVGWEGPEDCWCVDSGLALVQPAPNATLTVSSASGSSVTLTASTNIFSSSDVGKVVRAGGGKATIGTFSSTTAVLADFTVGITDLIPLGTGYVPAPFASGDWTMTTPVTTVSGLDHLENREVAIVGDGNVFNSQTVSEGTVVLSQPSSQIVVGLAYTPQLQTLDLDVNVQGGDTVQGKRKKVPTITVRVAATRGLKAGMTFDTLHEIKQRRYETMGQPIPLATTDQYVIMDPLWAEPGRLCLQQDYPMPATVLGLIPDYTIGDTAT